MQTFGNILYSIFITTLLAPLLSMLRIGVFGSGDVKSVNGLQLFQLLWIFPIIVVVCAAATIILRNNEKTKNKRYLYLLLPSLVISFIFG